MGRVQMARELSTTQLISLRDAIKAELLAAAVKESGKNVSEFVIRDAMPLTDFGFNTEKWVNQTAMVTATWTKDWSKELPKSKFVSFYGFVNHASTPVFLGTKFKVGSNGVTVKDIAMHGRMRAEDIVKCYIEPVIYKGGETIYIEHYQAQGTTLAQYGEELEMMCFICEPYGEVISGK